MNRDNRPPIIRLELEGVKHTLNVMLVEYADIINSEIRDAVDKFCTPDNLQQIIDQQVEISISAAVKDEINEYFRYGAGRAAVRKAVLAALPKEGEA